jgi:hypothetical protein
MTRVSQLLLMAGCLGFLLALTPHIFGDEGMWLFTNPPRKYLKEKYQFDITDQWLTHLQRASVRFNSGGSGSFVSPNGLVLTNHHVGADYLQKVSTKDKDYYKDGFLAKNSDQEILCKGAELNVLQSIEDVTERVNNAVKGAPADTAAAKRREVLAEIEKESTDKTGLKSQVVTLYQGGQYHLYRFKVYTDVRLVFAPEAQIAFYGGDPDNFEYPRFDLDMCLFRIYENGKPAKIEHYLKWSQDGAKDNELVFVSGHPGRTNRLNTVAELEYLRDIGYPFIMQRLNRLEVMAKTFSDRSTENARQAKELLFSVQNSRKARLGGLQGLQDPDLMARKKDEEKKFQETAASKEDLKDARGAWDKIAEIQKVRAANIRKYQMLEGGSGFSCDLFGIARTLVRAGDERPKPNGQRLREYGESNLPSLKVGLFSDEEIYDDWEIARLTDALMFLCAELGYNSPLVQKVLAGKAPTARAAELIKGCTLKDVKVRKELYDGGKAAVDRSKDPMIALVKLIDEDARAVRKVLETQVDEASKQAYAEIAKVKFAREGTSVYPDATFTLRLAFGVVKGYEEAGKKIPAITTFAGLYERSKENNDKPPFDLPPRWVERKSKLNLSTPFNFVCTADIIGGNSGSPVVNARGELVGLIFDGNIQSLVLDFAFTEEQARAVSVHSAGIIEAMRKIYDANELADELTGKKQ